MITIPKERGPLEPAMFDEGILHAWLAVYAGTANDGQQKRFSDWLMRNLCHLPLLSFHENERIEAFLEGQRSIGVQLGRMIEDGQGMLKAMQVAAVHREFSTRGKRGKP